ncbi:MAG TPA: pyruvate kinase, partial [Clostridia bacterium]|nr:pyruvate kinase [Clostridia bacterium]
MKKTKIVCTIGPASESKDVFEQLVMNGLDVARLNFSHGSHEEHEQRINTIKEVRWGLNKAVAILLDTKGSEIRTGKFKDGEVELIDGQDFTITTRDVLGDKTTCSISYDGLPKDVNVGDTILIDDGLVGLRIIKIANDTDIECTVENGGIISNNKGVNVPGVK